MACAASSAQISRLSPAGYATLHEISPGMHRQAVAAADHETFPSSPLARSLHLHILGSTRICHARVNGTPARSTAETMRCPRPGKRHRLLQTIFAGRGRLLDERGVQRRLCGHHHRLDPGSQEVARHPHAAGARSSPPGRGAPHRGPGGTARTSISGWSRHCARYVFTCPCARPSTPTVTAISGKLPLRGGPPGPIASAMGGWPRRSSGRDSAQRQCSPGQYPQPSRMIASSMLGPACLWDQVPALDGGRHRKPPAGHPGETRPAGEGEYGCQAPLPGFPIAHPPPESQRRQEARPDSRVWRSRASTEEKRPTMRVIILQPPYPHEGTEDATLRCMEWMLQHLDALAPWRPGSDPSSRVCQRPGPRESALRSFRRTAGVHSRLAAKSRELGSLLAAGLVSYPVPGRTAPSFSAPRVRRGQLCQSTPHGRREGADGLTREPRSWSRSTPTRIGFATCLDIYLPEFTEALAARASIPFFTPATSV